MSNSRLDEVIRLLQELVEQGKPTTIGQVNMKIVPSSTDTYIRQVQGKLVPVRGADTIAAKDVVPDLDAISIDNGKTYAMVVDAQYLENDQVELTTDAGYAIKTSAFYKHKFRASPLSYGD